MPNEQMAVIRVERMAALQAGGAVGKPRPTVAGPRCCPTLRTNRRDSSPASGGLRMTIHRASALGVWLGR